MKRLKHNEVIKVLGVSFNGVKDAIEHARRGMPKKAGHIEGDEPGQVQLQQADGKTSPDGLLGG